MSDPDPYVPPRSEVKVVVSLSEREARMERMLRWVGAGCMVGGLLFSIATGRSRFSLFYAPGIMMWLGAALAFLCGGRWWHLTIAILMAIGVVLGVVVLMEIIADPDRGMSAPMWMSDWVVYWVILLVDTVALVCAAMLFVRRWKKSK